ncbi:ankyrin repeat-containing domain protein [Hyaloraphidium curvatum]|nr:ankyrin repeat-containing domain protein [Hyaloraphidium curvatum]
MALAGSSAPQLPAVEPAGALFPETRPASVAGSAYRSPSLSPKASQSRIGGVGRTASTRVLATKPDELALIAAAQAKDAAGVDRALAAGANPNARGTDGRTALMHAARLQDIETAKVLLAANADPNLKNSFGYTPVATAATLGNAAMVDMLLAAGADPESRTAEGMTPLLLAAQGNHLPVCRLLVSKGADVEARGRDGRGAIHWFARQGDKEAVEWLVKEGKADTELRNKDGYTAVNTAAALGDLEMVKLLADLGANLESRNNAGHTPLLSAILLLPTKPGNLAVVEYLIKDTKANVNSEGEDGRTALHHACRLGELDITKMLVEDGAKVDSRNVAGFTPLNTASFYGQADIVEYLLDNGADPNLPSQEGWVGWPPSPRFRPPLIVG